MKKLLLVLALALVATTSSAQVVPTNGKRVIKVKESHGGEYMQAIRKYGMPKETKESFKTMVTKKLKRYGFNNITITEVGMVDAPSGLAAKLASYTSNERIGQSMLSSSTNLSQARVAVTKMGQSNDVDGTTTMFQVNFIDNNTGQLLKLRVSGFRAPRYIIKESDQKGLSKN